MSCVVTYPNGDPPIRTGASEGRAPYAHREVRRCATQPDHRRSRVSGDDRVRRRTRWLAIAAVAFVALSALARLSASRNIDAELGIVGEAELIDSSYMTTEPSDEMSPNPQRQKALTILVAGADPAQRAAVLHDLSQSLPEGAQLGEAGAVSEVLERAPACSVVMLAGDLGDVPAESLMRCSAAATPTFPSSRSGSRHPTSAARSRSAGERRSAAQVLADRPIAARSLDMRFRSPLPEFALRRSHPHPVDEPRRVRLQKSTSRPG